MTRRSILIVSILIAIALAGAAFILFSRPRDNAPEKALITGGSDSSGPTDSSQSEYCAADSSGGGGEEKTESTSDSEAIEVTKIREVKVVNNSPEYDLKVSYCENSRNQEYIRLEYYKDGIGTQKELDTTQIPELKAISSAYLNPRYSKAYLITKGNGSTDFVETAMYVFNLKDQSFKKLFSNTGNYAEPSFSIDYKYMAYSFYDSPASSIYQENSLLEIINSVTDEFVVKGSRDLKGVFIGGKDGSNRICDYTFTSWSSNTTVKLKETVWTKKTGTSGDYEKSSGEVFYDIERNLFVNLDGSIMEKPNAPSKQDNQEQGNQQAKQDSDAVRTLANFYSYLASENDYGKALELLGDEFTLEMNILKQFGVEMLTKNDIDIESASIFAELLRAAKLDNIVMEETKGDTATIYYYQLFSAQGTSQLRQPVIARLKKTDGRWLILEAKEASGEEVPFKQ